jgi:hypothetical protein
VRPSQDGARRRLVAALAFSACLAASAAIADDAATRASHAAYELAMKCFVANGVARGDSRDAHDETSATAFEKRARESFDIAGALGDKLGYSGNRQSADFGMAQTDLLPKFVMDKAYLRQTENMCKSAGL